MGRSHCATGLIFGCLIAATLSSAPLAVRLLIVPVAGGAALLPDIDKPGSRVARSLGPVTKLLATGIAALAVSVFYATRTELDTKSSNGGHRRLTHTGPGALLFGLIVGIAVLAHPIAGAVVLALLIGLTAQGFRSIGTGFTLTGAGLAWWTISHYSGWWPLWVTVTVGGSLVHCLGDSATNSGTPLLWPLTYQGKRWHMVRFPVTFTTNDTVETELVTPALMVLLVVSGGFATGLAQVLIHAVTR